MLIYDIADYAVAERTRDLPDHAIHHAKRAVIDWCAATAPGSLMMPATGLIAALTEDVGHGRARLFPSGERATMRAAALINAAASHTAEFDDIFRDAIYHPATPTVSTALAVAEHEDLTGALFLRAVIVGYEISTRIATVMGSAHYKYWHNTATNGSFGAASAAASALGLDRDRFAHALGLAGTMAAGLQQSFRSDSHAKPMHGAHAADSGLLSAVSAAHGVTGALDILEGEVGFGAAMSKDCDWALATEGLGRHYNIARMTSKNYGCCGHAFAAIDAALALKAKYALTAADIGRVDVGGYAATVEICGNRKHSTPFEGKFSVPYLVATAITHGEMRMTAFTEERLHDPVTSALVEKIDVHLNRGIAAEFPHRRAARMKIVTTDGRTLEHYQPTRRGDPDLPLSDAELDEKFFELTVPVMGRGHAEELLAACWSLETLQSVRDLPFGGPLGASHPA